MKISKSKPISNISTIIQIAVLIALSIHSANAQNSATRNMPNQRNDFMGKDSTNLVPNTQMGTVQNFTNTSTSTYTSPQPINGACGASYGATVYSTPTALCSSGTPSAVSLSGNIYRWSCNGLYSGSSSSCVAYEYVPPPPPPPPTCQFDFSYSPLPPCGYVQPPNPICIAGGWNIQWLNGTCGYKP